MGRIAEIGNTAITTGYGSSEQSTNFRVKVAVVESHPKIRPGMSSTVDITTDEHFDVLTVPIQAIVMREFDPDSLKKSSEETPEGDEGGNVAVASTETDDDHESSDKDKEPKKKIEKKGVFVNRDGIARFVEITTGINDQQNYEVVAGLEDDDEVITGSFRILRTIKDSTDINVENRHKEGESD